MNDGEQIGTPGHKEVVRGKKVVCSTSHPIVTSTILQLMRDGANAIDAAVAGSLLQPVVEPHLTSHGGSVSILYWEAKSGTAYQINGLGTYVPGMALFRPLPADLGGFVFPPPAEPPSACIPGFMPALQAVHERFGSKPWDELCQPAIHWAEEGHSVSSFEYGLLQWALPANTYLPSGREFFLPDGFTTAVGQRFKMPQLAETLRRLAEEGPDYFVTGGWAQHFVEEANRLGWPISLAHMTGSAPRWQAPLRYEHNGYEIVQLSPPEVSGVFSAFFLGVLSALDLEGSGHFTETAENTYLVAHALRRVAWEMGLLHDPKIFDVPLDVWLSGEYQQAVAKTLKNSRPKIDLSEHVRLTSGNPAMAAAGLPTASARKPAPNSGSCELSIVDAEGNWVQMINTVQTGGIPGAVVDGVPMWGSHAFANLAADITGWTVGGGRARCIIGNTLVLKQGHPWLALGTPGDPWLLVPQVLWSILDAGMEPYAASVAPRMWPLRNDYVLEVESRIPQSTVEGLAKLGVRVKPLPPFDQHMGSFQMCWRDEDTGLLNSSADPRRTGRAGGL